MEWHPTMVTVVGTVKSIEDGCLFVVEDLYTPSAEFYIDMASTSVDKLRVGDVVEVVGGIIKVDTAEDEMTHGIWLAGQTVEKSEDKEGMTERLKVKFENWEKRPDRMGEIPF